MGTTIRNRLLSPSQEPTDSVLPMSDRPDIELHDATDDKRYEARIDGELAGWADYAVTDQMLVFTHTEVLPAFEGQGVGSALARYALDDVRCRGLKALAVCPFILGWMQRHPKYADLEYRSRTAATVD